MFLKCNKWSDSKELFGCSDSNNSDELNNLCQNLEISSATSCMSYVFIFRGGKYWRFDGNSQKGKPFGELIGGGEPAKDRWPHIHFPGGFACDRNRLIAVYSNKWSLWTPDDNQTESQIIVDKPEVIDQPILDEEPEDDCERPEKTN